MNNKSISYPPFSNVCFCFYLHGSISYPGTGKNRELGDNRVLLHLEVKCRLYPMRGIYWALIVVVLLCLCVRASVLAASYGVLDGDSVEYER